MKSFNRFDYDIRLTSSSKSKWKKRGIAVVPTKNNIGFEVNFLNQTGALINIYQDGSVWVSIGTK